MKRSITLSEVCERQLGEIATAYRANLSVVVEAAIMRFAFLSVNEQQHLLRRTQAAKKAYTRTRWRTTFWHAMREEFWLQPLPPNIRENELAPRSYAGFQTWFLLNTLAAPEPEDGPFYLHIVNVPLHSDPGVNIRQEYKFARDDSPYDAARKAASFIKEQGEKLGLLEFVALPGERTALLDHTCASWRSTSLIEPASLPIVVSGKRGSYVLERDAFFRATQ